MRSSPTTADARDDADLPADSALRATSLVPVSRVFDTRSTDMLSISIFPNRPAPRRFSGARFCEPQHLESDRRSGIVRSLGGRQSSRGSQTRAPLVTASWRFAVSQVRKIGSLGIVRNLESPGSDRRLADYKSALRYTETQLVLDFGPGSERSVRPSKEARLLECRAGETPALL